MAQLILIKSLKTNFKKKFAGDSLWLLSAQFIMMGVMLVSNLMITSKFGNDKLGVFNQGMAFLLLVSTIVGLGLNNTITKYTADHIGSFTHQILKERLVQNILFTLMISTMCLTGFIFLVFNMPFVFSSDETREGLCKTAYALPLFSINKNFQSFLVGLRKQKDYSIQRILRWILVLFIVILSCYFFENPDYSYYSFFISELILSFFMIGNLLGTKMRLNFENLKIDLTFGLKSYVSELIAVSSDKLDVLVVGYFLSNSEVGIFSFVTFFAKSIYLLPSILMQNVNPIISKAHHQGKLFLLKPFLRSIFNKNIFFVTLHAFSITALYFAIVNIFQTEFENTFGYLLITITGTFIYSFIHWLGGALVMTKKLKVNLYRSSTIFVLNNFILIVFTYFFGLTGAMISVSVGCFISFILMKTMLKRHLGIELF
jgi:O-antigen/teichoic acid export membrane protein